MNTYKIHIAYDGTSYAGWQIQLNSLSIQQVIQDTMSIILKEKISIRGASRTDTGVHAKNQTAHFKYPLNIDPHRFIYSMNSLLPADIRIKTIEKVSDDFHSQYMALSKTYHYNIHLEPVLSPFNAKYCWHIRYPLNLEELQKAAKFFLGTHDFTTFSNESHQGAAAKNAVRTLYRLDFVLQEGGFRLEFEGNGFLYKMVRNLTSFLVDVGAGKKTALEAPILLAAKDRTRSSKTAPPQGLFLVECKY